MDILELKAKVYDLMKQRALLILQAKAIETEIEQITQEISEAESSVEVTDE